MDKSHERWIAPLSLLFAACSSQGVNDSSISSSENALTGSTTITSSFADDGVSHPIIQLSGLNFEAGVPRYIDGQFEAGVNVTFNVLQGARIICDDLPPSVNTTLNNQGSDVGTSKALVRALFTPITSGAYTCTLMGHASGNPATMTVVASPNSWLRLFDTEETGATQWGDPANVRVAPGSSAFVLRKTFTALHSATEIDVNEDVEMTNLTSNSEDAPCDIPGNSTASASVTTTIYATQLNAAGTGCRPAVTATKTTTINKDVHHLKVFNSLRGVSICRSSACADPGETCTDSFALKLLVSANAGFNPVCVHGSDYSNGIAFNNQP